MKLQSHFTIARVFALFILLALGGNNRALRFAETNGPSAVTLASFNGNAPTFDLGAWIKI